MTGGQEIGGNWDVEGIVKQVLAEGVKKVSILSEATKKYNNLTNDGGVHASQREIGTDSHRKYVEKMVPGSDWGKQFINKYRKK